MIVLEFVSEDLCDIWSGILVDRLTMLKVNPVSLPRAKNQCHHCFVDDWP